MLNYYFELRTDILSNTKCTIYINKLDYILF